MMCFHHLRISFYEGFGRWSSLCHHRLCSSDLHVCMYFTCGAILASVLACGTLTQVICWATCANATSEVMLCDALHAVIVSILDFFRRWPIHELASELQEHFFCNLPRVSETSVIEFQYSLRKQTLLNCILSCMYLKQCSNNVADIRSDTN